MARTWPATFRKRAALAVIDAVGYAVRAPLRLVRREKGSVPIRKILVIEPWEIGDVVLATPLLAALRRLYPDAAVSLLAKPHAAEILEGSELVDDFITVDLPWTKRSGKYRTSASERAAMSALVRRLRSGRFDLVLDARGDPRTHLLAALARARTRIGFDLGGGWLLTHALPTDPDTGHKVDDWLKLLTPLTPRVITERQPKLKANAALTAAAKHEMVLRGAGESPIVGIHPGASHPGKTWPLGRFEQLSHVLRSGFGGSTIIFHDAAGYGEDAEWPPNSFGVRAGLGDLKAYLAACDLIVCNDSGPMHLADALGIPVVAVFERGNPQWFGPSGDLARVVAGEDAGRGLSPAPVDEPPANPIEVQRVVEAAAEVLRELGFASAQRGR